LFVFFLETPCRVSVRYCPSCPHAHKAGVINECVLSKYWYGASQMLFALYNENTMYEARGILFFYPQTTIPTQHEIPNFWAKMLIKPTMISWHNHGNWSVIMMLQ
jgi:hypothetical protein